MAIVGPLQSMPLPVVGLFGLIGVVLIGLALREVWLAFRYRSRRPTPIRALGEATGRVLVTGVAHRHEASLTAPITGADCLAYAWRISALRTIRGLDGSIETRRHNIGSDREAVPFVIEDDTGSVLVDPTGAELRLAEQWVADPVGDPVDQADVRTGTDPFGGEARGREYYESRLDDGETVTVRGRVTAEESLVAGRLGVRITGGGTLIEDATPGTAAGRALRRAIYAGASGLFILVVLALLLGIRP